MPSSYTSNAGFEKPADGEQNNSWGDTVNDNMDILDRLTSQVGSIALVSTTYTLTTSTSGAVSEGHYSVIKFTGSPGGTCTVTISPNSVQRIYTIYNASDQTVTMTQGSGGNVSIAAGAVGTLYCDGAGSGAAVVSINESPASNVLLTSNIGSTVQAYDADLSAIGALAKTDGNFIVANGSTWVAESGNTALASLGVTATGTELNKLDGVTWTLTDYNTLTATAAELNILDGVTATTAELNILDGVTATTAELNYVDGVTSPIQTQLDAKAANTTQSQATWEAGTGTTETVVSPAKVKAAIDALAPNPVGSALSWTSWANGSQSSVAHSLGSAPTIWFAYMECTSADAGFSVGAIVPINYSHSSAGYNGATTYADATNIYLRVGSGGFNTYNSSGVYTADFDPTKWTAKVRIIS